jgi:hypothetical protein
VTSTGATLAEAIVKLIPDATDGKALAVLSGPDGSFSFDSLAPGNYTVSASSSGYSGSGKVTLVAGNNPYIVYAAKLASASRPKPRGDYAPCLFDHDDEAFFRGERYSLNRCYDSSRAK